MEKKTKTIIIILAAVVVLTAIISTVSNHVKKSNTAAKMNNYYTLSEFLWTDDFNEFYKDSYDWYKSIENENGVYLANTDYYSNEILQVWKENKIYDSVPDKAFWYYTVSPSYLKQMQINLSEENLKAAINGTRLYLIPDTFTQNEIEQFSAYIKEDALKNAQTSTIKTTFTDKQEIRLISYTPSGSYFTFPSEKGQSVTAKEPIIYVCTSANMKFYESESLIATGVDSYIKFEDKDIMKSCTNKDELKQYHLQFKKLSTIYKNAAKADLADKNIDKLFE